MTLIGTVLGLLASLGVGRLVSSQLSGVSLFDPATFGSVAILLIFVTVLASYFPAMRATKVNSLESCRSE
jgi:ABC-type antimicrobial peptide transport system permease subunit